MIEGHLDRLHKYFKGYQLEAFKFDHDETTGRVTTQLNVLIPRQKTNDVLTKKINDVRLKVLGFANLEQHRLNRKVESSISMSSTFGEVIPRGSTFLGVPFKVQLTLRPEEFEKHIEALEKSARAYKFLVPERKKKPDVVVQEPPGLTLMQRLKRRLGL